MKTFSRLIMVLAVAVLLSAGHLSPSVVKGTVIATVQGEKCVEDLQVGDDLFGVDIAAQVIVKSRVNAISSRSSNSAVVLTTTREEVIPAAPDQQFFDPVEQQWILASDFALTNHLLDSKGNHVLCREVMRCNADEEVCVVYDISTEAPHTFFVTNSQFLTHNAWPIVLGFSIKFGETLASIGLPKIMAGIGAFLFGAGGLVINHAQAVRDLEKCFKDSLSDPNKKHHILQDKHKWTELVPDPKNNWGKVVEIITTVMTAGVSRPDNRTSDVFIKAANVCNRIVEVQYRLINGIETISNAWVK